MLVKFLLRSGYVGECYDEITLSEYRIQSTHVQTWNRICVKLKPICVIIAHMNLKFNHPLQYIFTVVDCLSQLHDK